MPTNVTPQYRKAEEQFKAAETREEKIAALENMIALLPKHKGTDKLFASLKQRLAKLRSGGGKKGARRGLSGSGALPPLRCMKSTGRSDNPSPPGPPPARTARRVKPPVRRRCGGEVPYGAPSHGRPSSCGGTGT